MPRFVVGRSTATHESQVPTQSQQYRRQGWQQARIRVGSTDRQPNRKPNRRDNYYPAHRRKDDCCAFALHRIPSFCLRILPPDQGMHAPGRVANRKLILGRLAVRSINKVGWDGRRCATCCIPRGGYVAWVESGAGSDPTTRSSRRSTAPNAISDARCASVTPVSPVISIRS